MYAPLIGSARPGRGDCAGRLSEQGITAKLTDAAKNQLAELGFDPSYGARPLRRVMQKEVTHPLAKEILKGTFVRGDRIVVDVTPDGFVFRKAH